MNMKHLRPTLLVTALSLTIMGCTPNISPDVTQASNANTMQTAIPGTIIAKHMVTVKGDNTIGTVAGGALGAIGGSAIGGSTRANLIAGIAGAGLGAAAGNVIQNKMTTQKGIEYVIRLDTMVSGTTNINRTGSYASQTTISRHSNGAQYINVVQGQGSERLTVGQRVMVAGVGSKHVTIISTLE